MLFDLFGYQFNIFEIPLLIFLMGYFIIQYLFFNKRLQQISYDYVMY
jgi:hypothetical protein